MKVKIESGSAQGMTCEQIDTFVKACMGGVRTSLDEPEGGYEAPFPLEQGAVLPSQINATDGIYSDSKEKLEGKGINVTLATGAKEYVRLLWDDEVFKSLMLAKYPDLANSSSVEYINSITSAPEIAGTDIESMNLNMFPNIKSLPFVNGNNKVLNLSNVKSKYIENCGYFGQGTGLPKLLRLVLPSLVGNSDRNAPTLGSGSSQCVLDVGPNVKMMSLVQWGGSSNLEFVIRSKQITSLSIQSSTPILFVDNDYLATFKELFSSLSSRTYPIGGPTWASTFGSTDPYADLTPEEKSWYEELFPTLYDGWQAPTED